MEKTFPENLKTAFDLPMDILPPLKNYIFTIPTEGSVFDYRFIKEVCIRIFMARYTLTTPLGVFSV